MREGNMSLAGMKAGGKERRNLKRGKEMSVSGGNEIRKEGKKEIERPGRKYVSLLRQ